MKSKEAKFSMVSVVKMLIYLDGHDEPVLVEHKNGEPFDIEVNTIKTPIVEFNTKLTPTQHDHK